MIKRELKKTRQYKSWSNNRNYITVPLSWCTRFDLSPTDLFIYCVVKNATEKAALRSYTGSVKGLCAACNVSIPTARKSLEKLIEKGFLRKEFLQRDGREWVSYTALSLTAGESTIEEVLERNQTTNAIFNGRSVRC